MKRFSFLCAALMLVFLTTACSQIQLASHLTKRVSPPPKSVGTFKVGTPYNIKGKRYYPREQYEFVETGIASWYGPQFHGKQTANGEIFDMNELTAAHRTLQMPSLVRVTNLENGRSLIVRVNDRGPFARGRVIDLSRRSAELLGFKNQGTAKVRIEVLSEESKKVAQAAKDGIDTSGFEVAMNRTGRMPASREPVKVASASRAAETSPAVQKVSTGTSRHASVQSVQQETLTAPAEQASTSRLTNVTPGHVRDGNFYPDPVVTEYPVTKTDIYVQAGAFTVRDNANNLSRKLAAIGPSDVYPAVIDGTQFYRVRLGPVQNVEQADAMLDRLIASGNNAAIIVVE